MLKKTLVVTLLSFSLSIVTFINQLVFAKVFGAGKDMDLFVSISSIPTLVSGLVVAALSYSLTPHLIQIKIKYSASFTYYIQTLFTRISLYALIICITGGVIMHFLKYALYPPVISHTAGAYWINIIAWVTVFFSIIIGLITSYYNSENKFHTPLLLGFLPYIGCILMSIFAVRFIGILAVPVGQIIGTIIFVYVLLHNNTFLCTAKQGRLSPEILKGMTSFFKIFPLIILAMLCFSIYQSIDAFWAPKIGESNLSYLSYCQRILIAIGSILIIGPSTVLIPHLTKAIAENRRTDFLNDATTVIKLVIALSSLVAAIGSILAEPIISVMFERGAFTHKDTVGIASILPYMLVGMVFMLCVVMLFRIFFVRKLNVKIAFLGVACAVLYFVFSGIGVQFFGLKGIAMGYILTWVCVFLVSIYHLFKEDIKIIFCTSTLNFCVKQILLLAFTSFIVVLVKNHLAGAYNFTDFPHSLMLLTVCGSLGLFTYLLLALTILEQKEIAMVVKPILRKRYSLFNA